MFVSVHSKSFLIGWSHFTKFTIVLRNSLPYIYIVAIVLLWLQGLENGSTVTTTGEISGPRPLSVPDVDKLQLLHEPRIDSYRFSMANLEGKFLCLTYNILKCNKLNSRTYMYSLVHITVYLTIACMWVIQVKIRLFQCWTYISWLLRVLSPSAIQYLSNHLALSIVTFIWPSPNILWCWIIYIFIRWFRIPRWRTRCHIEGTVCPWITVWSRA
jgi:hypothetical protein